MTIFDILYDYSLGNVNEIQLKSYVRSNFQEVYTLQNDMTIYSYATLLSERCLLIIHETALEMLTEFPTASVKPWEIPSSIGYRPIHYAVELNFSKQLLYLISVVGVDVNAADINGDTALHIICNNNYLHLANILLYAGSQRPNINIINKYHYTPLTICIKNGFSKLASVLLTLHPLLEYKTKNMSFNLLKQAKLSEFIEIVAVFKKYERTLRSKRSKVRKRNKVSLIKRDFVQQYNFFCNSLNTINYKSVIYLARSMGIFYSRNNYKTIFEIKPDLCDKISKQLTLQTLQSKLN